MMSGYRATGIHPLHKQNVPIRFPNERIGEEKIESTDFLKESRCRSTSNQLVRKRRLLDAAPGKSTAT